jgi:hypothetical protein
LLLLLLPAPAGCNCRVQAWFRAPLALPSSAIVAAAAVADFVF